MAAKSEVKKERKMQTNKVLTDLLQKHNITIGKLINDTTISLKTINILMDEPAMHIDLKDISIVIFIRLSEYFDVSIDYLLWGE